MKAVCHKHNRGLTGYTLLHWLLFRYQPVCNLLASLQVLIYLINNPLKSRYTLYQSEIKLFGSSQNEILVCILAPLWVKLELHKMCWYLTEALIKTNIWEIDFPCQDIKYQKFQHHNIRMAHIRKVDWLKILLVQHKNHLTLAAHFQARWLLS